MGADYLSQTRSSITRAGQEPESGEPDPYRKDGAPFDEPMLGIIGMWRQGGGANPHFALCVGEVMLRVGQRRIAWTAFERAGRLADRYWPDPAKQQFLREHCRRRQQFIESTLPVDEVAELRPLFEAELAYGERYQREYQEYEAKHIAAGADIHDEHFFDDFHRDREPIATTPGSEEWLVVERFPFDRILSAVKFAFSGGLFTSGLTALLAAVWLRRQRG